VDRIVEIGGADRLRLIHANDSMDVRGAHLDRHQRIGEGHIGVQAFRELFAHRATAGVPFVLETPGSREPGNADLALLKQLRTSSIVREEMAPRDGSSGAISSRTTGVGR